MRRAWSYTGSTNQATLFLRPVLGRHMLLKTTYPIHVSIYREVWLDFPSLYHGAVITKRIGLRMIVEGSGPNKRNATSLLGGRGPAEWNWFSQCAEVLVDPGADHHHHPKVRPVLSQRGAIQMYEILSLPFVVTQVPLSIIDLAPRWSRCLHAS